MFVCFCLFREDCSSLKLMKGKGTTTESKKKREHAELSTPFFFSFFLLAGLMNDRGLLMELVVDMNMTMFVIVMKILDFQRVISLIHSLVEESGLIDLLDDEVGSSRTVECHSLTRMSHVRSIALRHSSTSYHQCLLCTTVS